MSDTTCRSCIHRIGHFNAPFACAVHLDYKTLGVPFDCMEHAPKTIEPEQTEFRRRQSDTGI